LIHHEIGRELIALNGAHLSNQMALAPVKARTGLAVAPRYAAVICHLCATAHSAQFTRVASPQHHPTVKIILS